MSASIGTLYGLSVGPGDPELLTVKALRLLQSAPVVAFPEGIQGRPGMAQRIVEPWLRADQIQLCLHFPYVQSTQTLAEAWYRAAEQVWQYLTQGNDVAFACEGDISFYSTFTYLAETLQLRYPAAIVQRVPGVCSPLAAAAVQGQSLVRRDQRLAVLPALYNVSELEQALDWAEVVVLMKMSSVYPQIWRLLRDRNLLASSYGIERATCADQVVVENLCDRADWQPSYFSLLVIDTTRQYSGQDNASDVD